MKQLKVNLSISKYTTGVDLVGVGGERGEGGGEERGRRGEEGREGTL